MVKMFEYVPSIESFRGNLLSSALRAKFVALLFNAKLHSTLEIDLFRNRISFPRLKVLT